MNKFKLTLVVFAFINLHGCGMKEMMEKTERMKKIVLANCNCDDVKLINYSEENFRTSAYMEVIGTNVVSKEDVAIKINNALKEEIDDYCDIDLFEIDFVNKGTNEIVTIRYCKIDE